MKLIKKYLLILHKTIYVLLKKLLMLKIEFKKSDVTELQHLSYKHLRPHVQRK